MTLVLAARAGARVWIRRLISTSKADTSQPSKTSKGSRGCGQNSKSKLDLVQEGGKIIGGFQSALS